MTNPRHLATKEKQQKHELPLPADGNVTAVATDDAGNVERTGHVVRVGALTRR